MVTAYDFSFAEIAEKAGVDIILVGDSLANVMLGKKHTSEVNMEVMKIFVKAVALGAPNTHICADLPYQSYTNEQQALENATEFIQLGAHSVKLEGYHPEIIHYLYKKKVPVIGHLGLLPQTATSLKQVGTKQEEQYEILNQAQSLEKNGACSIVLEHLNFELAKKITSTLACPTIGIGAGKHVNGQVLVLHDLLGIHNKKSPPFAKKFSNVYQESLKGITSYVEAVKAKTFP